MGGWPLAGRLGWIAQVPLEIWAGRYLADDELPRDPVEIWAGRYLADDRELPQVPLEL
jgi:lambda repressor-like predicted transcriptional regulator